MVTKASDSARTAHRAVAAALLRGSSPADRREGTFRVTVRGVCMEPCLRDGQQVVVRRRRWALPGDIVAFERAVDDPELAVHRLLGVRRARAGWVLITQADNEPQPDPAFVPARLLGVADVPVALRERARALLRWLPALVAPLSAARRQARRAPVSMSGSVPP